MHGLRLICVVALLGATPGSAQVFGRERRRLRGAEFPFTRGKELAGKRKRRLRVDRYIPISIGGMVQQDNDLDGAQDTDEPGIPNAKVALFDCSGNAIQSTYTNDSGYYLFEDIPPGVFYVQFGAPEGFFFSRVGLGYQKNNEESGGDETTGQTTCMEISSGEQNLDVDAVFHMRFGDTAMIGGLVWHDFDGDGLHGTDEEGFPGVVVELHTADDGSLVGTKITSDIGEYVFENLTPNNGYYLKFINPDGYQFTKPGVGANDRNSDADLDTGETQIIFLDGGEYGRTWDAGLLKPDSIGS